VGHSHDVDGSIDDLDDEQERRENAGTQAENSANSTRPSRFLCHPHWNNCVYVPKT
jgi:hypothetical protein